MKAIYNDKTVKLVSSKITRKSWLEDSTGKRITPKFVVFDKEEVDKFVVLRTQSGNIIYHKELDYLPHSNNKAQSNIGFMKIAKNIYSIDFYDEEKGWKAILYNADGVFLTDEFSIIHNPKNGRIAAKKDGYWGFLDNNLNEVVPFIYKYVEDFTEFGFTIVILQDDRRAVIDLEGNYILQPTNYDYIRALSYSFLKVEKENKCGVINLAGSIIVPVAYDYVELTNNYFKVKLGKKYGLIGIDGTIIFECIYPEIIETLDKFVVSDFARKEILKSKEINKL